MKTNIVLLLKSNVLIFYLTILLFLFTGLSLESSIRILVPLALISLSIHTQKKDIAIFGFSLYCIVSLTQISITSLEQLLLIFAFIIALLIPSLILLLQILSQTTLAETIQQIIVHLKPLSKCLLLAAALMATVYIVPFFVGEGMLFREESIQKQIIFIAAISLLFTTPFLLKKSKAELKTDL